MAGFLSRRRLLVLGAGAALAGLIPVPGMAATGEYEAMLVSCIDPRFVAEVHTYMGGRGMKGQYSQFVIAGGPAAIAAPAFADWHKAFWDNLAATIQLHNIKKVVGLTHRDCGAVKIAYGEAAVSDPAKETAKHKEILANFRTQVGQRQPKLGVETGIMALGGAVEMIA
ncbi:MAG: hypothetical protein FJX35_01790 [Alphaproteobacteria bacterium]|nr:hypothetical protein [Alphaproteobacteria bacterium]